MAAVFTKKEAFGGCIAPSFLPLDAYHTPYSKHYRYWTGLGLFTCCCTFTIFGICNNTRIILMSITTVVFLFLVISRASNDKLYRNKVAGLLLELFYLSNLGILATVMLINDTAVYYC